MFKNGKEVFELMKAATKSIGRTPYAKGYCCSLEVQTAGHAQYCAKKVLRQVSVGLGDDLGVTEDEALSALRTATQKLWEAQSSSREHRDVMLHQLAKKEPKNGGWRQRVPLRLFVMQNRLNTAFQKFPEP